MVPPIRSLADIQRNTERLPDGRFVVNCGPDSQSILAFSEENPFWTSERASHASQKKRNAEWAGTGTYAEAAELLHTGWPKGTVRMRKLIGGLSAKLPKAKKPVYHYRPSVAPIGGLVLNIHDIITGGPQVFVGRFKGEAETLGRKIVRMAVNNCVSAGTKTPVMEGRGAAVMALITMLETLKVSVDVTLTTASLNGLFSWHVKPAGFPINQDQLAFALINNAAFRRLGFAMIEHAPEGQTTQYYHGYGYPNSLVDRFPERAAKYDIVIDSECAYDAKGQKIGRWEDPQAQIAWVKTQLEAQGIHTS